jgi:hypothetical protein
MVMVDMASNTDTAMPAQCINIELWKQKLNNMWQFINNMSSRLVSLLSLLESFLFVSWNPHKSGTGERSNLLSVRDLVPAQSL